MVDTVAITSSPTTVTIAPGANTVTIVDSSTLVTITSQGAQGPAGGGGGGGVTDGDKGDVIVSGTGTVWSLDYTAVNAAVAPVWANITSKPAAVTALSGTNTGDQTITLTGAITGSGTGSFVTTLAASVVALSNMANVATGTVFYRKTAAAGAPEVQTLATLKTDLGLTGTNSGDQTITLTGDITGSGAGSFAATLATVNGNVGSFGSASQVPTYTVNAKGLTTAAANVAISIASTAINDSTTAGRAMLTAATATAQTALLDVATTTTKGLVPAPSTATGKVLSDAMTWITVSGGGSTFLDGAFRVQNTADNTKQLAFSVSGFTTATTRTITVPDITDTMVTLTATQTLTNKTIGNTNTIAIKSGSFTVQDSTDTTKQFTLNISGFTTAVTRTWIVPNTIGGDTFAGLGTAQTFSATQTFSGATNTFSNSTIASTTNLATGANGSGITKTVNIGTSGAAGSTTTIIIGALLGTVTVAARGTWTFNSAMVITPVAVASLPSAATAGNGARHHVTDALTPTFGATVAGGGAVSTPVYSDGTNWKVG